MVYVYDGSLEGAFSAIYQMFHDKGDVNSHTLVASEGLQYAIFEPVKTCETQPEWSNKVVQSILDTFGPEAFRRIGYAYLSEDAAFGTKLYRCLKRAYKLGERAMENLSDPDILALYKCYNAVARESHSMMGLIRFSELNKGIYYAHFEPTYDLLGLVIPHFKARLADQIWVIHDTKRKKAAFYNKETVHISDLDDVGALDFSSVEMDFQKMWRTYFDHIAIIERKNPKLQQQKMPKKYWKFLTEKDLSKNLLK